ncbi:MAG: response regulator transcription factor [Bacteroidia bacterium]|nr:response regulator transcription factor [Bacteroidia bacterium]
MRTKIKIIIAEDQPVMRRGYVGLFSDYNDLEVIGEAANGEELLELLKHKKPDIVLLDIEMPVMNGGVAFDIIKEKYPKIKVIISTIHNESEYIIEYLKKGANAYVSKDKQANCLIDAIYAVHTNGFHFDKSCSDALLKSVDKVDGIKFTEREMEIILLIALGKTNKEISTVLNVVLKTIDFHKANMYKKTKTYTSAGLLSFAYNAGIVISKKD